MHTRVLICGLAVPKFSFDSATSVNSIMRGEVCEHSLSWHLEAFGIVAHWLITILNPIVVKAGDTAGVEQIALNLSVPHPAFLSLPLLIRQPYRHRSPRSRGGHFITDFTVHTYMAEQNLAS